MSVFWRWLYRGVAVGIWYQVIARYVGPIPQGTVRPVVWVTAVVVLWMCGVFLWVLSGEVSDE